MRKDYQGDGKRDNKWNEKKTHRADQYLEAGDMHNEAFEEYYRVQVGAGFSRVLGCRVLKSAVQAKQQGFGPTDELRLL
jgi:hypothetical protein